MHMKISLRCAEIHFSERHYMTISLHCERYLCNYVHYIDKFTTLYSESKSTVNVTIRCVVTFTTLFLQCMHTVKINTVPSDYIPNSYL